MLLSRTLTFMNVCNNGNSILEKKEERESQEKNLMPTDFDPFKNWLYIGLCLVSEFTEIIGWMIVIFYWKLFALNSISLFIWLPSSWLVSSAWIFYMVSCGKELIWLPFQFGFIPNERALIALTLKCTNHSFLIITTQNEKYKRNQLNPCTVIKVWINHG